MSLEIFDNNCGGLDGGGELYYASELHETEMDKRLYTILGNAKLMDNEWMKVMDGNEVDYCFFNGR